MIAFPKPGKKRRKVSPDRLDDLWREAVRLNWGYRDPFEDRGPSHACECHHIKRRGIYLLRWNYRNGIYLTMEHHEQARKKWMKERIRALPQVDTEYLDRMEKINFKGYLLSRGITEEDFMLEKKAELEQFIRRHHGISVGVYLSVW